MTSPTPDFAELRRRYAALTPFALRFLSGGPGEEPYIAPAGEDGSPLSESGFDAVLLFAEIAAADLPDLLDAAAERDALAAKVERVRALHTPRGVYETASHGVMWHCLGCERNYSSNTSSPVPPCPTIRALDEEPQP